LSQKLKQEGCGYRGDELISTETLFEECICHIQLTSEEEGGTLLLMDPGRGFRGLLSVDKLMYSFRIAEKYLQNY